jgi:hypothetical protein
VWHEVTLGDQVYEDTVLETEQVCQTPCVLDLPLGHQLLAFPMRGSGPVEVDEVSVSATPSLYRRALADAPARTRARDAETLRTRKATLRQKHRLHLDMLRRVGAAADGDIPPVRAARARCR